MTEQHERIGRALDRLVGRRDESGDWNRVVAEAERRERRGWIVRIAVVAVAAAVAVGAALVSPFEGDNRGVLEKALAAIGDGPVVHVVTRGDWGANLVDLSTGRVRPVYGESEVWYDPQRGVHYISRLGDEVAFEDVLPPNHRLDQQGAQYIALANHYRDELKSGKARVVASGRVGDREVVWIRVRAEWYPDSADEKNHLFAEEVAVDRATYEPVYLRSTRDGRAPPGSGQLIRTLETLDSGQGDFTVEKPAARPGFGGFGLRRNLNRAALQHVFGGRALWLGRSFDRKPLVEAKEAEFRARQSADDEWDVSTGISLFYGWLLPRRGGIRIRDNRKPFVQLLEATELSPGWRAFRGGVETVPEGSVMMAGTHAGLLVRDGVYISVSAKKTVDVLKAAAALRPVGAAAPRPTRLDFDGIASRIRPRSVVATTGIAPVQPRPLVRRRGKRLHATVAKGVEVETFAAGLARFDTRGMDADLREALPPTVTATCFGVRGGRERCGASGEIPRSGVREIVVTDFRMPPHRIAPPVRRFDACQIGAGFGRNWLPRYDWHWPIELPLTDRGHRFFEDRAAALELAHFVRNGSRLRARKAMKRGAGPPAINSLRDPARPHIRVRAIHGGFRAEMRSPTGRRFFVDIVRGRIGRTNANRLAFVR